MSEYTPKEVMQHYLGPDAVPGRVKLAITTEYTMSCDTVFELPEGKSWDDVAFWHVKWGTLFIEFNDNSEHQVETDDMTLEHADFKRPNLAIIRHCDADGDPDYGADSLDEVMG